MKKLLRRTGRNDLLGMALLTAIAFCSGCHHSNTQLLSELRMNDSKAASQLLYGFYPVESQGWRWTAKEFSVVLQPLPSSDIQGAQLMLRLFIPDSQIQQLGPITLTVDTEGCAISSQKFSLGSEQNLSIPISPVLCRTNVLPLHFRFNKALPPSNSDARELGAVITYIGLQTNKIPGHASSTNE